MRFINWLLNENAYMENEDDIRSNPLENIVKTLKPINKEFSHYTHPENGRKITINGDVAAVLGTIHDKLHASIHNTLIKGVDPKDQPQSQFNFSVDAQKKHPEAVKAQLMGVYAARY